MKTLADNKKSRFNYSLEEFYEAGIVLEGWEVKSILAGRASINEAYVKILGDEVFLIGSHFTPISHRSGFTLTDASRSRKLLLHRQEISKLIGSVRVSGYTIVPVKMVYKNKKIKLEIALAKGKNLVDKRADKKDHDIKLELNRTIKSQKMLS